MTNPAFYSIVIPAYNAEETIKECLDAVLHLDYPQDLYEIIVVDDGSTDNTVSLVESYPVKLIQHEENKGRIHARNTGAQAASYKQLVFVDTRVIIPSDYLNELTKLNYLPVVPHVITTGGWFNRVMTLIRWRYYYPHYPITQKDLIEKEDFHIHNNNWGRWPIGTTSFACQRDIWLASQPSNQSKHMHDDTVILSAIAEKVPLLKSYRLTVKYLQRETLATSLNHVLHRAPRFLSYYLVPGGAYFKLFIASIILCITGLIALLVLSSVVKPTTLVIFVVSTLLFFIGIIAVTLARRISDIPLLIVLLPTLTTTFGVGLLWGITIHWRSYIRDKS